MLLGNGPDPPRLCRGERDLADFGGRLYRDGECHHTNSTEPSTVSSRAAAATGWRCRRDDWRCSATTLCIGLYGLFAATAAGFFSENLGIDLPWWVYAFVAMAIIAVLGYRQVDLSVKVLAILVSLEFLIVLILDAAILIQGGQGGTARRPPPRSRGPVSQPAR